MPKMNKYDRTHLSHLSAYERLVDAVYREYMRKLTSLMPLSGEIKPSVAFSFDECPNIRKRAESLLEAMREGLFAVIVNGIDSEWTLANNKNNELSRQVFGENIGRLTQEQYRRYFSSNGSARDAFIQRRTAGMNLSDRVWNLTSQFKCEMEQVIDISIRNGIPAEEMQRELQQYLKHPDNFFRRFRFKEDVDDMGNPIYGRKWKKRYWDDATGGYKWMDVDLNDPKYRYGRGVYRSSYKNARRLAVTETNIAYRTADHLRWQQMDFVVGIRIEPSKTNHPVPDICDFLAGDYPKDFKWTGWHPHCRCHATSILKTPEEMAEDNRRILAGQEPADGSVNEVKSVPPHFTKWLSDHEDEIMRSRSIPYFISDNPRYTGITPRMSGANGFLGTKLGRKATKKAYSLYADSKPPVLIDEVRENIEEIANELKTDVKPMNFEEADSGNVNPNYKAFTPTGYNCQSCVAVFEARLRGLNLEALPYDPNNILQNELGEDTAKIWLTRKGKEVKVSVFSHDDGKSDDDVIISRMLKQMSAKGRYHIGMNFESDKIDDHIIVAETMDDGEIVFYDPQRDDFVNIKQYPKLKSLELLKVDKLIFNKKYLLAISRLRDL